MKIQRQDTTKEKRTEVRYTHSSANVTKTDFQANVCSKKKGGKKQKDFWEWNIEHYPSICEEPYHPKYIDYYECLVRDSSKS